MSDWRPRRFWTEATAVAVPGGHAVHLDGRPVRTPAKAPLVVPAAALAQALAGEWQAQDERVDPTTMPFNRMANSAIDKVAPNLAEVAWILSAYAETDLLCHRAEGPEGLVRRQAAWDAPLDWAASALGARLHPTRGVMPAAQDRGALGRLHAEVAGMDPFRLTAFHDLVALTGSLILGLAAARRAFPPAEIWGLSRLDEDYQAELWGRDPEALAAAESRRRDFQTALDFLAFLDDRTAGMQAL